MLQQMRQGVRGLHCFHESIIFSTYLTSLGFKTRLWALENRKFEDAAHTVVEVYCEDFKKWICIDVHHNFYIRGKQVPLSLLELRDFLLTDKENTFVVHYVKKPIVETTRQLPHFYKKLVHCVFLRANNDFINKYDAKERYGHLYMFKNFFDVLPNSIRKGLSYLIGKREVFIHYVDEYSKSLKWDIVFAKLLFYFLILSLLVTLLLFVIYFIRFYRT
jgi:hypothetical protein